MWRAILLASVIVTTPSLAQDLSVRPNEVADELAWEFAQCSVVYSWSAKCVEGRDAKLSADVSNAAELAKKEMYLAGKQAGMTDDALLARFKLTLDTLTSKIAGNCAIMDVLVLFYTDKCKPLLENPQGRMGELLSGRPAWPNIP